MILIVDSGSSKTQWYLCRDNDDPLQRRTEGLNPRFTTDAVFCRCLHEAMGDLDFSGDLFFYGAGCSATATQERYRSLFRQHFPDANIHIEDDMTGACRAMLGYQSGLVGILGTGSNACRYDGHLITNRTISTGYILGDEGSGNHIGRRLWKDYWAGKMPQEMATAFYQYHQLSLTDFLSKLYQQPHANRFLAEAALFAAQHKTDEYIQQVLICCMNDYLSEQVLPLCRKEENNSLALVGSVAACFCNELEKAANNAGIVITQIAADPMHGLVEYHTKSIHSFSNL